ncbi:MAG: hypothetical protein FWH31_09475 [Streptococcaceae bacterium]|nr:hypothetical protein [Streptococcaceae bacterium]
MSINKKNYFLYFLNLISSSLLYSFITLTLISLQFSNSLIIVFLSSVASLLILGDIKYSQWLEKIPIKFFSLIAFSLSILLLVGSYFFEGKFLYLSFYFAMEIVILSLSLVFQTKILKDELTLSAGFLNMQILRTVATMFGFLIGSILGALNQSEIFFYVFILITAYNLFATFNYEEKAQRDFEFQQEKVKGKQFYFIIGLLSTATTLWIPLIIQTFVQKGIGIFSWIPFILPGIFATIFMLLQKRYISLFRSHLMEFVYIPLFLGFYFLRFENIFPMIQAILFSMITALSLSLTVRNRKYFLQLNLENNMKYILQSLAISSGLISLFFSLFGKYEKTIEFILMFLCLVSVGYMIKERKKLI